MKRFNGKTTILQATKASLDREYAVFLLSFEVLGEEAVGGVSRLLPSGYGISGEFLFQQVEVIGSQGGYCGGEEGV